MDRQRAEIRKGLEKWGRVEDPGLQGLSGLLSPFRPDIILGASTHLDVRTRMVRLEGALTLHTVGGTQH